ncbi:MAG: GNAT family N-acetyltransferase [Chitinophagales bacterium]|nr:GNAT family N-acetyltransferase [Chitinophagales bacterium]
MQLNWRLKAFGELSNYELYEVLKLRSKVFVVEQNCVFLDMDDKDTKCLHLMGFADSALVAYSRLVPAGVSYKEMSIGRVVTDPDYRAKGMGMELMELSVEKAIESYGTGPIRIGAQLYLKAFYERFGFNINSAEYIEDGIPHIEMLRL